MGAGQKTRQWAVKQSRAKLCNKPHDKQLLIMQIVLTVNFTSSTITAVCFCITYFFQSYSKLGWVHQTEPFSKT